MAGARLVGHGMIGCEVFAGSRGKQNYDARGRFRPQGGFLFEKRFVWIAVGIEAN